ncbi:MAG: beta-ketoacyl-[acyl-carrier-protein] synthase family protein [Candidatus Omnitrophica bacterium]|nr:beta-ketoacyl-[acyl-carrier-protein] synthase family protein [Candidatus Omnitrophota bacterium]
MRRVVITGIGPVTSTGTGREDFFEGVINQRRCIREIPAQFERGGYSFKSRYYSPCPEIDLNTYGFPKYYDKVTQNGDKLALAAASLALDDARFKIHKAQKEFVVENLDYCGVIMGIGISSLEAGFHSYLGHVIKTKEEIPQNFDRSKIHFNRMIVPMLMPNSVSSWISISYGLHGASYTVNAACASGILAIGDAFHRIQSGSEKVMLTGGVECLSDAFGGVMRGFDVLGVLSQSPDGVPQPFSKTSTGFLFSQGAACVLVLEEYEHAIRRGANIYAEIIDFQSNSDAYNIVQMDLSGVQIKRLLQKFKAHGHIDYLNAHGSGTMTNDAIEAEAIIEIFGSRENQPYINSTKGILGHTLGASGALETAVTALAIRESKIHSNRVPAPRENLNLPENSMDADINIAISTSYGFGGHNAGIALRKCNG